MDRTFYYVSTTVFENNTIGTKLDTNTLRSLERYGKKD